MSTLKADVVTPVSGNTDLSLSGTGTGGVKVTDFLVQSKGSDIASATALVLGKDGNEFDVTGTTTITSITTQGVGSQVTLQFDGVLTFTHHATDLILPGGASITTAAGDIAEMYEYASGDWRCVSYTKASGKPISLQQTKGSDIASATSLNLGADGSNLFDVTGTTTITSIASQGIGSYVTLQFDGALIFTHHATDLVLPGGANITTAAGDIAVMYEYASGDWRCVTYTKATGTAIVAAAGGASDAEKTNIFVNAFRISVNGGLTKQNMVDGTVDEYTDRTGINTAASSNIRDQGFTDPAGTVSASGQWTRDTGSFNVVAAGHIHQTGTTVECENTTTMTGYWKMTFTYTAVGTGDHFIGIFDADDAGTNTNVLTNPDTDGDTVYFHDASSPADFATGANQELEGSEPTGTNLDLTAGDDIILQLTAAGTITWTVEGVLMRTMVGTFATTRNWRFAWEGSTLATTPQIDALTFYSNRTLTAFLQPTATTNMVAVSETVTALAQPSDVFIVIHQQDVAAITLNTDIKAYASRDAGSTWTQITLAAEATLAVGRILTGSVSISGQPAGTSMRYKIETLNAKDQKINGTGLQWS